MNITVIRRGRVGGDASAADVVDVPGHLIGEALRGVTGLNGQVTIDTTNLSTERDGAVPSLAHQVKSVIGGPTAKAFNTVFASAYELIGEQRLTPSNLYAAEPDAKDVTARLIGDAGYDPLYVGDLDPGARLLEDSSGLTRALAGQIGVLRPLRPSRRAVGSQRHL
ncbi:dinucleotide-binding protein [Streptomyces sp. NPDC093228]|uniref:dinucleotide-binding protein n=1 Tax=Streptomyces sp. NPDC093228 TaxID=3155070 RepID=UPI003418AAF7